MINIVIVSMLKAWCWHLTRSNQYVDSYSPVLKKMQSNSNIIYNVVSLLL